MFLSQFVVFGFLFPLVSIKFKDPTMVKIAVFGMWHRIVWYKFTDVAEEPDSSIIRFYHLIDMNSLSLKRS
jgi:hypothetical protein